MKQPEYVMEYVKNHFSSSKTLFIAQQLGVSQSMVRRVAKQLNLTKSNQFLEELRIELIQAKRRHYPANQKYYSISSIQRNIIVGSLIGDASLALYGRSKNAYFREHGCDRQRNYRLWKCKQLSSLDFKLDGSGKLHSPSHPIYTELYKKFYTDQGVKFISKENLALLDHPIGLACLYMDDGTLVIDSSGRYNKKYLFPRISLYTLCFSMEENQLIQQHIEREFNIPFKLKKRPDGKNYILELTKRNSIFDFLEIVKPFVSQIPCMSYKVNLDERLQQSKEKLCKEDRTIILRNQQVISLSYTTEDESHLILMKRQGKTDQEIANSLNRSYWSVVDKIRRLRKIGKI